jgi:hypothetical protein
VSYGTASFTHEFCATIREAETILLDVTSFLESLLLLCLFVFETEEEEDEQSSDAEYSAKRGTEHRKHPGLVVSWGSGWCSGRGA